MNCSQCGEVCHCSSASFVTASVQWIPEARSGSSFATWVSSSPVADPARPLVDPEHADANAPELASGTEPTTPAYVPEIGPEEVTEGTSPQIGKADETIPSARDSSGWRDEVAARLIQYRARRKSLPPRYPSLLLPFEQENRSGDFAVSPDDSVSATPPAFQNISHRALALHGCPTIGVQSPMSECATRPSLTAALTPPSPGPSQPGAKIIEFPRTAASEMPVKLDELAEPVVKLPRILEGFEVAPAPALGGIMIETVQPKEIEKRPGIDFPLQSAPLSRRLIAAAFDGAIIAAACSLFGFIFWKVVAVQPPRLQCLGLAAGIPCLLWAAYQHLLIVYSGSTPGLRLAGLEVARFDGSSPNRRRRLWRVLASYLSAISLGMGYAWLFLDEDALCWHDRITHTYLAPKKH